MEMTILLDCGSERSGGVVMADPTLKSIADITAKRAELLNRSAQMADDNPAYDELLLQLEQLDWQLAHTNCESVVQLKLKFARLAELICPQGLQLDDGLVETALARSITQDLDVLSRTDDAKPGEPS